MAANPYLLRMRSIARFSLSSLLADESSKEAIAIDSGWEISPIIERAVSDGLLVKFAVATHNHFDHVSTLPELAEQLGAKVVAHVDSPIAHDLSVGDGDILQLGGKAVKVLHTPGHTEDSICLYDGGNLFTGDTLFIGNCGRTDLPGGSPEKLFWTLQEVILKLPQQTMIYPGHDYGDVPCRRLDEEAKLNPTLSASSYRDFFGIP
jgi:hydroxyacylglutathione hydrolase